MLTRSSQYALQALIEISRRSKDGPVSRDVIAGETELPAKFLSKLLSDLARAGIVDSKRGPGGGFVLSKPAEEILLFDIVSIYETFVQKKCPFGNQDCSDENPCLAHPRWKVVLETQLNFFQEMSLHDVAHDPATIDKLNDSIRLTIDATPNACQNPTTTNADGENDPQQI